VALLAADGQSAAEIDGSDGPCLVPAEAILLRCLVVFGGTCEPGEAGRHMDEGVGAMPVEASAKVPLITVIISGKKFSMLK
jgi:hypothetical protein